MAFKVWYVPHTDPAKIQQRLVRNPNYGGKPTPIPGACVIKLIERKMKPKFFAALKENVEKDGFRNPVLLYRCPKHGLLLAFGGSRVRIAKELDREIPAIVVDYAGRYEDGGYERVTPDNWRTFFRDVPALFEFTHEGVDTHYSLERNRRQWYDPEGMAWVHDHEGDTSFLRDEFPWILND